MYDLDKTFNQLITDQRSYRQDENERDHDESRLPQLMFTRPRDTLGFHAHSAQIFLSLSEYVHFLIVLVGRVGGNRTPMGGFGDRCTAIVLLP